MRCDAAVVGGGEYQTSPLDAGRLRYTRAMWAFHIIRVNPETTPVWEPIAATLTKGQKWTRAAGVDWSSWRRWARGG
jgi:hypothetical protein